MRKPPAAPPLPLNVACICGRVLHVDRRLADQHTSCPGCGRRFLVAADVDLVTGEEFVLPMYLEGDPPSGDTVVADPSVSDAQGAGASIDAESPPDPPDELFFQCPCGTRLAARREMYGRKVGCPKCGEHLILTVRYDEASREFVLRASRLRRAPGETWVADPL